MPSLQFKGKALVQNHHLVVPFSELEAVKKNGVSKSPSLHDNLIIEGDNLKALKALLPAFHGKIKCIYIDPPYNTGNEAWIYNDKVNSPMIRDWLGKTVDRDDLTRHDKWCCMMLPRLKMLRELLSEDGVIFVSIDDNEVHHLRCLMDTVFGEQNFVAEIVWKARQSEDTRAKTGLSTDHEYIVCYAREEGLRFQGVEKDLDKFDNPDNDHRGHWRSADMTGLAIKEQRPNLHYDLIDPKTKINYGCPPKGWRYERSTMAQRIKEKRILWPTSATGRPRQKLFKDEMKSFFKNTSTVIDRFYTSEGTKALDAIFGNAPISFPKPLSLVKFLIEQVATEDSIILDSFAGSGTTAHAVLALNKEDGGNRRFILCQMPYETKEQEANKDNICDTVTAERVRRVIKGVPKAKDNALREGLGGTFSYFKLGKELQKQAMLDGKNLPGYDSLAGYVFFTATGEEFKPTKINRKSWFIGTSRERDVFLIYEDDIEKLKDMALNLELARSIAKFSDRPKLVFAPTKYLDQDYLEILRIEFCQLPFEIYQHASK